MLGAAVGDGTGLYGIVLVGVGLIWRRLEMASWVWKCLNMITVFIRYE